MEHTNPAPTPSNPSSPPTPDEPALHRAARLGDHDEIRRLVAIGHDVNAIFNLARDARYDEEATPLAVAAGSGDGASAETVRLLLELGAKTNIGDNLRPIVAACVGLGAPRAPGGDAARLRVLLEHGASLPSTPRGRNELLCETAAVGDPARVQLLLDRGCDPRGYFDAKEAEEEYRSTQDFMLAHWTSKLDDPTSGAAEYLELMRSERMVQFDKEQFELAIAGPRSEHIPIHCAARSGSVDLIRLLVHAGADPLARSNDRKTAMHSVSSAAAARLLVELGLSLDDEDDLGTTPIREALVWGEMRLERVKALVEAGVDLHKRDKYGDPIFHRAVGEHRSMEILRFLVEAGADPRALSEYGSSAFHAAINPDNPIVEAEIREVFTYLRDLGVEIDQRTETGTTPLQGAICSGVPWEVGILCELGADPNAKCALSGFKSLQTPDESLPVLFQAIQARQWVVPKLVTLLNAGADPLYRDSNGHTLLMHVASILSRDRAASVELMNGFLAGLPSIDLGGATNAKTRDEFITHAVPPIRSYVEAFASRVLESPRRRDDAEDSSEPQEPPDERTLRWERKRHAERTECLVILATYSAWAQLAGGNVRERVRP